MNELVSCKIAAKLINESFEHKLSVTKTLKLKAHLAVCKTCCYYKNQILGLHKTLALYYKNLSKPFTSKDKCLSENSKKRIQKSLYEQMGEINKF